MKVEPRRPEPAASSAAAAGTPVIDEQNPWPGLVSFPETAETFFNGRDTERDDLLRLIRRQTLTLLYGKSGLGKSSLLMAGLFPMLRRDHFLPVMIRLDHDEKSPAHHDKVRRALLEECAASAVELPAGDDGQGVWELLHRESGFWDAKNYPVTPVLVIDQFEELFTLGMSTPERQARSRRFLKELGDLIDNRVPEALAERLDGHPDVAAAYAFANPGYKIVLSMREDYLAHLGQLGEHTRSTFQNYLRLLPMHGDTAVQAIVSTGGTLVEPDVARAIVSFLAKVPAERQATMDLATVEVEPPLLSLVCRELNERRRDARQDRIDVGLLDVSQTEILAKFYQESFTGLNPRVREFVEEELLTATGHRDAAAYDNAISYGGVDGDAIDALVARRLVRKEDRSGGLRIELTHDVLVDVVRESRDRRRAEEEALKRRREYEVAAAARRRQAVVAGAVVLAVALVAFLLAGAAARTAAAQEEAAMTLARQAEAQRKTNERFSNQLRERNEALRTANDRVAQREVDVEQLNEEVEQKEAALGASRRELARKRDSVTAMLRTTEAALRRADVSEQVAVVGAETADYYLDVTGGAVRRQAAQSSALDVTARADLARADTLRREVEGRLRRSVELEKAVTDVLCADQAKDGPRYAVRVEVDALLPSPGLCGGEGRAQAQGPTAAQRGSP